MNISSLQYSYIKFLLIAFIAFNIWHATNRGIWMPMSIMNSLHLSEATATVFRTSDPNIKVANYADDSQQVFIIAHDPLIRTKSFISLMDFPQYRYQRILYPMLCRILSFGYEPAYPYVLFLINLSAFILGGYLISKIANMHNWTKLVVLAYFANTGLLYTSFNDMTETLALLFVLLGIFYWFKERAVTAVICFSLGMLARETSVTVPFSIFIWEYLQKKITLVLGLKLLVIVVVPFVLWCIYIQLRLPGGSFFVFPSWAPPSYGVGRFSLPFVAMWQEAYFGLHHLTTHTELRRTMSLAVVSAVLILVLIYGFLRNRNIWSWIGMTQGIFVSMLRGDIWNYHLGAARVVIPLFLLFSAWCASEEKRLRNDQTVH